MSDVISPFITFFVALREEGRSMPKKIIIESWDDWMRILNYQGMNRWECKTNPLDPKHYVMIYGVHIEYGRPFPDPRDNSDTR